jgi:hypothetical protein
MLGRRAARGIYLVELGSGAQRVGRKLLLVGG